MNFASFKTSEPARVMFRKLGLLEYLETSKSWNSLRALIVEFNDPDKGRFVALARECDGVASSGERVLLHAICYAADFAWLADELTDGRAWQRMGRTDENFALAVAACIAQTEEAAVPELLEALIKTRDNLLGLSQSDDDIFAAMVRRINAAIAKATGAK